MQQKSNQRIVYLDLLRIMATFAVIFLHVTAVEVNSFSFSRNWYIATIGDSLVRWSVPVFVMISGALFLNSNKVVTCAEILKKRIPRLLLAYAFWSVLYALLDGFYNEGFDSFSLWRVARQSIMAPKYHLWFLPMLMGVYLLIPILREIARNNRLMLYTLIIWIVYVFVSFFQFVSVFKSLHNFYPLFNMNSVFGFSGYCLLGYYFSQQSFSRWRKMLVYLIGMAGASITIIGTCYMSMKKGMFIGRYFDNMSIQVMAMAVSVFVFVKEMFPKCKIVVSKFVDFVRKDLFGIYLTHVLWLQIINTYDIRHCINVSITMPIITIVTFFLSLFTTKLIRLIPFLRKVVE